jgi:exodeoxyribonuclease VII large subunit
MVADLRASTPTAAAEAVAPAAEELETRLRALRRLLGRALLHTVRRDAQRVAVLGGRPVFSDPSALTATVAQRIDAAAAALGRALPAPLARDRARLASAAGRLAVSVSRAMERARTDLRHGAERLEDLSPLGILARGYAVCYAADGTTLVRSASTLSPGDRVRVRLHSGGAGCVVETITEEGAGKP